MSIIIGIDPGSRVTGYGLIEYHAKQTRYIASGAIRTLEKDIGKRLYVIYSELAQIIQTYAPTHASVEKVFCHKNPNTALILGQARGAAMVALAQYGLPIAEYAPREIKLSVVGYGAAQKIQVQHMIRHQLGIKGPVQADAADALAIALCHAQHDNPLAALLRKKS